MVRCAEEVLSATATPVTIQWLAFAASRCGADDRAGHPFILDAHVHQPATYQDREWRCLLLPVSDLRLGGRLIQ